MEITIRNKKLTIDEKLVKCAREHFVDIEEPDCELIINAMLTPSLDNLGDIDFDYEYSHKSEEELSTLLKEGIIKELKTFRGCEYIE